MARQMDFGNAGPPNQIEELYNRAIAAIDGELCRGKPAIAPWEARLSLASFLDFKKRKLSPLNVEPYEVNIYK